MSKSDRVRIVCRCEPNASGRRAADQLRPFASRSNGFSFAGLNQRKAIGVLRIRPCPQFETVLRNRPFSPELWQSKPPARKSCPYASPPPAGSGDGGDAGKIVQLGEPDVAHDANAAAETRDRRGATRFSCSRAFAKAVLDQGGNYVLALIEEPRQALCGC